MINFMEKEFIYFKMEISMKDNGDVEFELMKEHLYLQIKSNMLESLKMKNFMDLESSTT